MTLRMDRRGFVRRAGMLAAGSALSGTSVGCAANEIYDAYPCMNLAVPPAAGPSMTYLKASEIGCALDCDLTSGLNKQTGGAATDDGPRINAAMAGATVAQPITLIMDGSALISGLFLPAGGYFSIQGQGCKTGFFIKTGTNNDGIHNGGPKAAVPSDPGVQTPGLPVPGRGSNVSLSNFVLNGNQGNGTTGDSTDGNPRGNTYDLWYYCINLMNLDNITIENVVVVNAPAYHIRLSNVGNVAISGCTLSSTGPNTDGIHFDGPANDLNIQNCTINCGDDAIALNCPEGYTGNISRVTVTNCTFNSFSMMRLYTTAYAPIPSFYIDSVNVSGCSGTFTRGAFLIGEGANSSPDSVESLTVTNCTVAGPAVLDVSSNFGAVAISGLTYTPSGSYVDVGYAFLRTISYDGGLRFVGASLALTNCVVTRNADVAVAAVVMENGSVIGSVAFNGYSIQDATGSAYSATPELLNMASGSIGQVSITALDSKHCAGPTSAGGFGSIGSVSGAGVLASGWAFPNIVMANGSPYLSADSNLPSIKVGGVVQTYP